VVISIIALLIAILLPALQEAREIAKDALCLSNLKQIGIMNQVYSSDYNDYHAPGYEVEVGQGRGRRGGVSVIQTWEGVLIQHSQGHLPSQQRDRYFDNSSAPTAYDNPIAYPTFYCPLMVDHDYVGQAWGPNGAYGAYFTNYGVNFDIYDDGTIHPGNVPQPLNLSRVRKPSQSAQNWDARPRADEFPAIWRHNDYGVRNGFRDQWSSWLYHILNGDNVGYIHGPEKPGAWNDEFHETGGGASNVLFLDGHATATMDPGFGHVLPIAYKIQPGVPDEQLWE